MKVHHRRSIFPLLVVTACLCVPATCSGIGEDGGTQPGGGTPCGPLPCSAQLLPPGDFRGKSLDEWGLDYSQWAIKTGLGGQTISDTPIDGVRYLPPNFGGGHFVADVTIPHGTALVGSPFFIFGERYENGAEDNPADPIIGSIFAETTIRTTFDGSVLLEGYANEFPDRTFDVTVFPAPIPYATPQPRGGINSVAALFATGITTIFDMLPVGEHTIKNEFGPNILGPAGSFTYNITVVPEPSTLLLLGSVMVGFMGRGRRR